jgi:hypothetical protein
MGTYVLLKRWKLQYYPGNTNKLWDPWVSWTTDFTPTNNISYTKENVIYLAHLYTFSFFEFTGDAIAEPVNGYLWSWNLQLMPWYSQIQYSYLHCNVIMCIDMYCHIIDKLSISLKISHDISTVELIPWKLQYCLITNQEYETTTL